MERLWSGFSHHFLTLWKWWTGHFGFWTDRIPVLADEVLEAAKQIIEDQSKDYTLEEVDEELEMLAKRGQLVRDHLEAGRRDGFAGHPEFKQAQRAVLGEVQAKATGVEAWLEKVRNDLYTAGAAVQRTRAVNMRQGSEEPEAVPVRVLPVTQPPRQAAIVRALVQWLANTIADLGLSRGSQPAVGAARLPEQEDALALFARTQALTSQSLQQVAEGLTRWTDAEMRHRSKDWPVFDGQVIHYIAWKREWTAHHQDNYPGLQGDALRRVLVELCLCPADKKRVRYRSTVAQVWEYLDRAYQWQDVFLHDLMKPVFAHKEIEEKNYRALEEYLDLLIRTFDIAEEAVMLPVVLHMNNLRPMYEKWPHGEQAKWWTHAERFDVIQQPLEFRRYIQGRYRVVATLASHMVIASAGRSSGHKDGEKKKDGGQKQGGGGKPPQKANVSAVTQQPQQQQQPAGRPQKPQQPCRLGASLCKEAHPLEKCDEFKKMSPEQREVKANELQLCLICLKHRADRECFAKGKPEFKGSGCFRCRWWRTLTHLAPRCSS